MSGVARSHHLAALSLVALAPIVIWAASSPSAMASAPAASPAPLVGDPGQGRAFYQACTGCHSLDENDVGPKHRGVVGRRAGIVPGYAYSAALKNSGLVWTPANLDRWLTNPQKLVPGAKMYFSVANPQQRADIIAYLAQQH
ncbi:c-type cytochrome [Sphingomonas sp. GlSt437]|uniref:c-type cytochrome n=1 Tax=Sphingomonas sp. GlSt437 TaxID=3389970 RepID=UPI003A84DA39